MKKILGIIFGTIFFVVVSFTGIFYWNNLRRIGPAVNKPVDDITEMIPQQESQQNNQEREQESPLMLPEGFSISIFAKNLGNARVMAWDPNGNILISIPDQGKVFALPDTNGDNAADKIVTVIDGLNSPHGLAFKCSDTGKCKLYIAETHQITVYDYDQKKLTATNQKKIIDLPGSGGHFSRTIMFMPSPDENKLLISVGSSCNVCMEEDWRRAKILIANDDGSDLKEFAKGVRNSVFMAIHPVTGQIWATEMGRDLLGNDLPPDEINIIEEGGNYGWPICYGKNIHDDSFDKNIYIRNPCLEPFEKSSSIDIQAHSSPLGLAFIPEEGWPEEYWHSLLVAYHGSWNRSTPTGYKIVRYKLDGEGNYLGKEDFITGWLNTKGAIGRPVDILVQPGGTMYISDDKAGVIYTVKYNKSES